MPTYAAQIDIQAPLERVFAYVADLERHPEWAADPLQVEAIMPGPVAVGKEYRSAVDTAGRSVTAALRVTDYQPPTRFGFTCSLATMYLAPSTMSSRSLPPMWR